MVALVMLLGSRGWRVRVATRLGSSEGVATKEKLPCWRMFEDRESLKVFACLQR